MIGSWAVKTCKILNSSAVFVFSSIIFMSSLWSIGDASGWINSLNDIASESCKRAKLFSKVTLL